MTDRFDHLHVFPADFDRSLAFYRDTLGWSVVESWGAPGAGRGAVLSGNAIRVVLSERDAQAQSREYRCPTIHLDIHSVDKRFASMPPGDHIVVPPCESTRGTRWFVVSDPDGNLVAFEELKGRHG